MRTRYNAYLTVYLSLVFGIVLSLLFVLTEGAAIGAARAQSELVADLGMDSVFAEYHRELLAQYDLFFVDSSYGSINGGIGMVEQHLADYMSYNMTPDKGLVIPEAYSLLKLENPYLEIAEVSCASDDHCMVWKAQAVNYMKAVYGGDIIAKVQEQLDTVESKDLTGMDVAGDMREHKKQLDEALDQKGIVEYGRESGEGYSYQKVSGVFDKVAGDGLLSLVLPDGTAVSGAVMDAGLCFSARWKNGMVNQGVGLHEGIDRPDTVVDELIYGEYLLKKCGNFIKPKDTGLLKYQVEYILYGFNSDMDNFRRSVEVLFAVRAAANMTSIYMEAGKKSQAETVAAIISALLLSPELTDPIASLIMGVWALVETVSDVRQLLKGGRVALLKQSGDWNTGMLDLFTGTIPDSGKSQNEAGLSYQDYLRIFLGLMDRDTKAIRSLDIVEMDIRQTAGNEHFRIDRCMDYMKVDFGFADAQRHDFVFYKKMCYE